MKGLQESAGPDIMDCEEEHPLHLPPSLSAASGRPSLSISSNSNSNSNMSNNNKSLNLPLSLPPPPPHAPIVEHKTRSPPTLTLSDNHFLSNRIIYKA